MNTDSTYTSSIKISSMYSDHDFSPDGDLNKKVWQRGKWEQVTANSGLSKPESAASLTVAVENAADPNPCGVTEDLCLSDGDLPVACNMPGERLPLN